MDIQLAQWILILIWKYQLVIHKGFNNEGIPEKRHDDFLKPLLNCNNKLKVFAINSNKIISK